jgi:hypothetical protein
METPGQVQIAKDLGYRFAIETKYDGDRVVCHKDGELIRFYTRRGNEDPNQICQFRVRQLLLQGLHRSMTEAAIRAECERQCVMSSDHRAARGAPPPPPPGGPGGRAVRGVELKDGHFKGLPTRYAFVQFATEALCKLCKDRLEKAASHSIRGDGAASVASFLAAVVTEIYLCNVCSCQEIFRRSGRARGRG